jgi:16S rRNA (adenine(1408)-N(1))-methyltransferase
MAEVSRRAADRPSRGGLPNALFFVAAAEHVPTELLGLAATVRVTLPWGSLLGGLVGRSEAVASGIASLLTPDGTLELLLAPAERDRLDGVPVQAAALIQAVTSTFEPLGLVLEKAGPATDSEVRATGSTWARRLLGAGRGDRSVVLIRLRSSPR